MPCSDHGYPGANIDCYNCEHLEKRLHSVTAFLCEVCSYLERVESLPFVSIPVQEWWNEHKLQDRKQQILAKLIEEERKILGV